MKTIDARGKNCPIPVIMTKKAISEGETAIVTMVDNKIAVQNLEKLAKNSGYEFSFKEVGSDFEATFTKDGAAVVTAPEKKGDEWAVFHPIAKEV